MKYEQIKLLDDAIFRRLTGVKRPTVNRMPEILKEADNINKSKEGAKISYV